MKLLIYDMFFESIWLKHHTCLILTYPHGPIVFVGGGGKFWWCYPSQVLAKKYCFVVTKMYMQTYPPAEKCFQLGQECYYFWYPDPFLYPSEFRYHYKTYGSTRWCTLAKLLTTYWTRHLQQKVKGLTGGASSRIW